MTSKRKILRKPANRRALQTVRTLTQRAQSELAQLIERQEDGKVKRTKLDTGLKKLQKRLARISMHEFRI